jgi:hypothetical protein
MINIQERIESLNRLKSYLQTHADNYKNNSRENIEILLGLKAAKDCEYNHIRLMPDIMLDDFYNTFETKEEKLDLDINIYETTQSRIIFLLDDIKKLLEDRCEKKTSTPFIDIENKLESNEKEIEELTKQLEKLKNKNGENLFERIEIHNKKMKFLREYLNDKSDENEIRLEPYKAYFENDKEIVWNMKGDEENEKYDREKLPVKADIFRKLIESSNPTKPFKAFVDIVDHSFIPLDNVQYTWIDKSAVWDDFSLLSTKIYTSIGKEINEKKWKKASAGEIVYFINKDGFGDLCFIEDKYDGILVSEDVFLFRCKENTHPYYLILVLNLYSVQKMIYNDYLNNNEKLSIMNFPIPDISEEYQSFISEDLQYFFDLENRYRSIQKIAAELKNIYETQGEKAAQFYYEMMLEKKNNCESQS